MAQTIPADCTAAAAEHRQCRKDQLRVLSPAASVPHEQTSLKKVEFSYVSTSCGHKYKVTKKEGGQLFLTGHCPSASNRVWPGEGVWYEVREEQPTPRSRRGCGCSQTESKVHSTKADPGVMDQGTASKPHAPSIKVRACLREVSSLFLPLHPLPTLFLSTTPLLIACTLVSDLPPLFTLFLIPLASHS